jgi:hypothetical protein
MAKKDGQNNNMFIWDSEKHTPAAETSKVNRRGGFTAVNHQYQMMRGTKLWGPYGEKWGMDIISMQFIGESPASMLLHCKFYYPSPTTGERCEFELVNDWPFKAGDDSAKKALTNTRSKALSMLGFAADVYHGYHDNQQYLKDEGVRTNPNVVLQRAETIRKSGTRDDILRARQWNAQASANGTISAETSLALAEACNEREAALKGGKNGTK